VDVALAGWRVATRVRQSYFAYVAARRDAALAASDAALRAQESAMVERRMELGHASASERDLVRLFRAESDARQAREGARVAETHIALAEAVGVPPDVLPADTIALPGARRQEPTLDPRGAQAAALLNRLDVHRALAQYAVAENALRLEIANQYPDVVLRPGYAWDRGDITWILAGFVLAPIVNRNEGPIAEAEARRALEGERFRALQLRVIGEARAAQARYQNAVAAERDALQVERDAAARSQRVERRFESGNADRLELTRARLETLAAARSRALASAQVDLAAGALEDALQVPLVAAVDPARAAVEPVARQGRP
jgi:outer membrane protein TolC